MGPRAVPGPHRRGQAVAGVVGHPDGLLLVRYADHGDGRPEDLLPVDPHLRPGLHEDGRLHEEPPGEPRHGGATAAQRRFRPLVQGRAVQVQHVVALPLADQRADLGGRVLRRAHLHVADGVGQPFHQRVGQRLVHHQPAPRRADLAGVAERGPDRPVQSGVEVGVVQDHVRGLPAQLEGQALEVRRGRPLDGPSGLGGAGERHLVNVLVRRQRGTRLGVARHDVPHPRREPCLQGQLAESKGGERRLLGRLVDDGVPAGQGGGELPRRDDQREVPRRDGPHHAERLAQRVGENAGVGRRRGAVRPCGPAGPVQPGGNHRGEVTSTGLPDGLAHVPALQLGQLVTVPLDQLGQAQEQPGAVHGPHGGPGRLRLPRGPHGPVDVLGSPQGHRGQRLCGGGIDGLEGPAVRRGDGPPGDEVPAGRRFGLHALPSARPPTGPAAHDMR